MLNLDEFERKLSLTGIDDSLVKAYIRNYKRNMEMGLFPELLFTNDEMPSDESFETLKQRNAKEPFHEFALEFGELFALLRLSVV